MPLPCDAPPRTPSPSVRRRERLARAVADAAASDDPALPRVVADLETAADLTLPDGLPEQSPAPLARRVARVLRHARDTPLTAADVEDALARLTRTASAPAGAASTDVAGAAATARASAGGRRGDGGMAGVHAP